VYQQYSTVEASIGR